MSPTSSARHCTAMAPCPAWGSTSSGSRMSVSRSIQPNRSMAATATTTAATEPSSPRDTRRSMFPRISVKTRSGRAVGQLARRRAEPVAMRPPGGSRPRCTRPARRGDRLAAGRRPARVRATWSTVMSLAECTAASARPSATAASTSVTKTPWPADLIERCRKVVAPGPDDHASRPPSPDARRRRASATRSVWRSAKGDPRVARRSGRHACDPKDRRGCAVPRRGAHRAAYPPSPSRAWWARAASWP